MQPICIMAALENELREILNQISIERVQKYGLGKFYEATLDGKSLVVVETNWGVVPATMSATAAIMHYQPRALLVTGISGALVAGMTKGDVVIVNATYNHNFAMVSPHGRHVLPLPCHDKLGRFRHIRRIASDANLVELATQAAQSSGLPLANAVLANNAVVTANVVPDASQTPPNQRKIWVGAAAAGEVMAFERNERARLAQQFGAIAVDMETIGEAHAALTFGVPYLAVRQISDDIFDELVYEETKWPALLDQNTLEYTPDELAQIAQLEANNQPTGWYSQPAAVFDGQTSWGINAARIVLEVARRF